MENINLKTFIVSYDSTHIMENEEITIGCKVFVNKEMDDENKIRAEILDIRKKRKIQYYVHYINYNKRLDEWVNHDKLILEDVEYPKKKKKTDEKKAEKSSRKTAAQNETEEKEKEKTADATYKVKNVNKIQINDFLVDAWYFSPYPKAISEQPIVYICSFCLFYFGYKEQFENHKKICRLKHPPGNEIYRKDNLSIFELDGHVQKNYCRNLCLLSKLFLDHKTLYYDIDPFLFYILCEEKSDGFHIVGYFSKEKDSALGYNVACILTLPYCQRKGYGRILIDFSYLLSRKEGVAASPEKPLSDLGLICYKKYWKEKIFALMSVKTEISVSEISKITSITVDDIMAVLSEEGSIKFYDGNPIFTLKEKVPEKEGVDEKCLEWEIPSFSSTQSKAN